MYFVFAILITVYFVTINLIAVIITIYDKQAAKKHIRRIPERTLIIVAVLGGSVVMYITMKLIRHKTRHIKFMLGIPLIFILQCAAIYLIWRLFNV